MNLHKLCHLIYRFVWTVIFPVKTLCVDSNIPCKNITLFPNNKPWVTKELKSVLNKKKHIFYTGSSQEKK